MYDNKQENRRYICIRRGKRERLERGKENDTYVYVGERGRHWKEGRREREKERKEDPPVGERKGGKGEGRGRGKEQAEGRRGERGREGRKR